MIDSCFKELLLVLFELILIDTMGAHSAAERRDGRCSFDIFVFKQQRSGFIVPTYNTLHNCV